MATASVGSRLLLSDLEQLATQLVQHSQPILDDVSLVAALESTLEKLFTLGLKDLHYLRKTRFEEYAVGVANCLPDGERLLLHVRKLTAVRSALGRSRAIVRAWLNMGALWEAVHALTWDSQWTRQFYVPSAPLADPELCEMLLAQIRRLCPIVFELTVDEASLDRMNVFAEREVELKHAAGAVAAAQSGSAAKAATRSVPSHAQPRHLAELEARAQIVVEHEGLLTELNRAIQATMVASLALERPVCADDAPIARLLGAVLAVFEHGLQQLPRSIARPLGGGRRKTMWDVVNTLPECLPSGSVGPVLQAIRSSTSVVTTRGRCGSFVRHALNTEALADYTRALTWNRHVILSLYESGALLAHDESSQVAVMLLESLNAIRFALFVDDPLLDSLLNVAGSSAAEPHARHASEDPILVQTLSTRPGGSGGAVTGDIPIPQAGRSVARSPASVAALRQEEGDGYQGISSSPVLTPVQVAQSALLTRLSRSIAAVMAARAESSKPAHSRELLAARLWVDLEAVLTDGMLVGHDSAGPSSSELSGADESVARLWGGLLVASPQSARSIIDSVQAEDIDDASQLVRAALCAAVGGGVLAELLSGILQKDDVRRGLYRPDALVCDDESRSALIELLYLLRGSRLELPPATGGAADAAIVAAAEPGVVVLDEARGRAASFDWAESSHLHSGFAREAGSLTGNAPGKGGGGQGRKGRRVRRVPVIGSSETDVDVVSNSSTVSAVSAVGGGASAPRKPDADRISGELSRTRISASSPPVHEAAEDVHDLRNGNPSAGHVPVSVAVGGVKLSRVGEAADEVVAEKGASAVAASIEVGRSCEKVQPQHAQQQQDEQETRDEQQRCDSSRRVGSPAAALLMSDSAAKSAGTAVVGSPVGLGVQVAAKATAATCTGVPHVGSPSSPRATRRTRPARIAEPESWPSLQYSTEQQLSGSTALQLGTSREGEASDSTTMVSTATSNGAQKPSPPARPAQPAQLSPKAIVNDFERARAFERQRELHRELERQRESELLAAVLRSEQVLLEEQMEKHRKEQREAELQAAATAAAVVKPAAQRTAGRVGRAEEAEEEEEKEDRLYEGGSAEQLWVNLAREAARRPSDAAEREAAAYARELNEDRRREAQRMRERAEAQQRRAAANAPHTYALSGSPPRTPPKGPVFVESVEDPDSPVTPTLLLAARHHRSPKRTVNKLGNILRLSDGGIRGPSSNSSPPRGGALVALNPGHAGGSGGSGSTSSSLSTLDRHTERESTGLSQSSQGVSDRGGGGGGADVGARAGSVPSARVSVSSVVPAQEPCLLVRPPPRVSLSAQCGACAQCGGELKENVLSWMKGSIRQCAYTGLFYCNECHRNSETVLPARLLWALDRHRYKVCVASERYITAVYRQPILKSSQFNPELVKTSRELQEVQTLRRRLYYISEFVRTCREREKLLAILDDRAHLMDSSLAWSIQDLVDTSTGALARWLEARIRRFAKHITITCGICKAKGYFCEFCHSNQLVYPFERSAVQCSGCRAFYHSQCYVKRDCPKCMRIARLRPAGKPDPQARSSVDDVR